MYESKQVRDSAEKLSCRGCGAPLARAANTGRPAIYCSTGCRREREYAVRRCSSLLHQAEKAEQQARLKAETALWGAGDPEKKLVAFWQQEVEHLRQELRVLLSQDEA